MSNIIISSSYKQLFVSLEIYTFKELKIRDIGICTAVLHTMIKELCTHVKTHF